MYGIFGREINIHTFIYGVYIIRFWLTLYIWYTVRPVRSTVYGTVRFVLYVP